MEKCAKKFGEEAVETALAAVSGNKDHLAAESADVLYHLAVLWAAAGITPEEVYAKLEAREGQSGPGGKSRARKRLAFAAFFFGQAFDQIQHALAHLGILDLHEGKAELQALRRWRRIPSPAARFRLRQRRPFRQRAGDAFIEEIDRHAENARHFKQAARADAVDAFFVFLNLLKCQAQKIAQLFLTHADQHAPDAHTIADLGVDGIGLFLGH